MIPCLHSDNTDSYLAVCTSTEEKSPDIACIAMLRTSVLVALFYFAGTVVAAPDCGLQPADIVFINDASGSVGSDNFQKTLVFIENVVKGLVIGPYDAQIGSVTFESSVHLEFHLNTYSNQQDVVNRVRKTKFTSGGTNTHLGIEYALGTSFTKANGMRTYAAQIAIVITDGDSNDKSATAASAKRMRDKGITVFSIGVGDGPDQAELRAIASDPDNTHVFSVNNFNSLNQIKAALQQRACEAKPAFLCDGQADIMFLLGDSDSVGSRNLRLALDFVNDIAGDFFVGADSVQIGVATFSTGFSQKISLRQHNDKRSLKSALSSVSSAGGAGSDAGLALRRMREGSYTTSAGHRSNVPKVAILVTSDQSMDRELTSVEAREAKEAGISILAIGVGPEIDEGELVDMASDGKQGVYTATAFDALKWVKGYVTAKLCPLFKQDTSGSTSTELTCGTKADIVFLVDSSGREENFKLLLNFIKSYVKDLDIGQDSIRVGVEKFTGRPYNEINLNRYNSTEELTKGINRIEPRRGGRDTAAAITYMDSTMFKTANGDRPEVPNIAIILTDGKSNRPEETKLAAARAKNNGIVIFSVGVGNGTSRSELMDMASDPDNRHVLTVTDFTKLNSVISAFQVKLNSVISAFQVKLNSVISAFQVKLNSVISAFQVKLNSVISAFQVKLNSVISAFQVKLNSVISAFQVKLNSVISAFQVQLNFVISAFQVKLNSVISAFQVKLNSVISAFQVKLNSVISAFQVKLNSVISAFQVKLNSVISAFQVKLNSVISAFQVKLNSVISAFQVKLNSVISAFQVKLNSVISAFQVKLNSVISAFQVKLNSVISAFQVKLNSVISAFQVKLNSVISAFQVKLNSVISAFQVKLNSVISAFQVKLNSVISAFQVKLNSVISAFQVKLNSVISAFQVKLNSVISAFQGQTCQAIPVTLPPYVPPATTTPTPAPDPCKDQIPNCLNYGRSTCADFKLWAATNCAKTCGVCTPSTPTAAPPCVDKIPDCPIYSISVCSGTSSHWARENCWRFCGYCSPGSLQSSLTSGAVSKCFYKGEEYGQGEKWDDGCVYECECADAETGQYVCYNKCPSFFNLPQECQLEQKAGKCCREPVCKFDGAYTSKEVDAMCVYNKKNYRQGQMWSVGCEFECICLDATTGYYACQSKCSKYESLPSNCKLVRPPGECCERPDCEFQTQVGRFSGSGVSRITAVGDTGMNSTNTSCVDKVADCESYPSDMCSSDTNRSFALENCRKSCNLCDPTGVASSAGVCVYQGRTFQQGNTWYDGCDKTCVCDDAESGTVRCEDRCPEYLNLPKGCTLVTVPGQCCRGLSCVGPATFTGSQTKTGTLGAMPVRVKASKAGEYPTLPPGQTYAPGQNPDLLVAPTSTQISGSTAQKVAPTPSSVNGIGSNQNETVVSTKITCDPAQEGQSTTLTCSARADNCPDLFKMKWHAGSREVAACTSSLCGSPYTSSNEFDSNITDAGYNSSFITSSLTIANVSRTSPFNMETLWTCAVCGDWEVLECETLQVYALPESPECTVIEDTANGEITSVTLSCSTERIYPQARCSFYDVNNGSAPVKIQERADYIHTETEERPVYYWSQCSVTVPVESLGEGEHQFQVYLYPDVTGGETLVDALVPNVTVSLVMPEATHSCFPEALDGSFPGNVTRCNCSLVADGYPTGVAWWFHGDEALTNVSDGILLLTRHDHLNQVYTCEAISVLGRNLGSQLTAKFEDTARNLAGDNPSPTAEAMESVAINPGAVAVAAVVSAVAASAIGVAAFLIKRHLSNIASLGNLAAPKAAASPSTPNQLIPMEEHTKAPPTQSSPDTNEYQTLDEATSTFKPNRTPKPSTDFQGSPSIQPEGNEYQTLEEVTSPNNGSTSDQGAENTPVYDEGSSQAPDSESTPVYDEGSSA
ncbi:hypothetical protein EGW08_002397 [Elysia chlorotica]|uniref:Uncharacterized protein n=1 Tax=Elysia chlorotica TaxID=188477 RepID=A0A433U7S5_ELYCH|nr:hypothetical protein EGW08_002397 [Elysia chlorotica]